MKTAGTISRKSDCTEPRTASLIPGVLRYSVRIGGARIAALLVPERAISVSQSNALPYVVQC